MYLPCFRVSPPCPSGVRVTRAPAPFGPRRDPNGPVGYPTGPRGVGMCTGTPVPARPDRRPDTERTPMSADTHQAPPGLTDEELAGLDAHWRAANYLSVGQI